MIEIFISLESAILAELKNVFISIVALLLSKLWTTLWPLVGQNEYSQNFNILPFSGGDVLIYHIISLLKIILQFYNIFSHYQ